MRRFFKKGKKIKKQIEEEKEKIDDLIDKLLDDYVIEKKNEIKEKLEEFSELYPESRYKIQKILEAKAEIEEIPELIFKVCIFGDGGVGKTTLLYRYIDRKFDKSMKMTIGADILVKKLIIENMSVTLQIWDFGGEERFRFFFQAFFRGSNGGIFMYDLIRKSSLMNIDKWLNEFKSHTSTAKEKQIPIILVGGKLDLQDRRVISYDKAINVQKSHNLHSYIECSSKTGENVDLVFETLARAIMEYKGYL